MIIPVLRHDALLRDIECADPGDGVCLWWLGQSGFLLKSASGLAVVDPYLSDSLTRKYAQTDKPHQRMTEIPLLPAEVPTVDFVSSSHNHTDHLDAETLTPILDQRSTPTLVYPAANRAFVDMRLGGSPPRAIGLRDGEKAAIGGWTVHGVVAAHDTIDRDEHGAPHCMGYVIRTGDVCVYHSGDTRWAPEILEQLVDFEIDAAILPINGALPTPPCRRKPMGAGSRRVRAGHGGAFGDSLSLRDVLVQHRDPRRIRRQVRRDRTDASRGALRRANHRGAVAVSLRSSVAAITNGAVRSAPLMN